MLEARNILNTYTDAAKAIEVLKGVTMSIEASKFVAITGPSGAGKSTLLHILGGLDSPTQGSVSFKGEDIYRLNDAALCKVRNTSIGFVFQFYHLLSQFTVLENVLMPILINRESTSHASGLKKQALELLREAGLARRSHHLPSQLSGGEQQRVAIVRALINSPQLLLCDEPTGNLDSKTGDEIIALIRKFNAANGMTIVLVTHNIEIAKSADRVYNLKDGLLIG